MSPFEAYQIYVALKMHFEDGNSYNYFRYNGKIRATEASFDRRRDVWQFAKLARLDNLENLIVANIIDSKLTWVGDLLKPEADEVRRAWERRQESLTYLYTQEIKKLSTPFAYNFQVKHGEHPPLLKAHMHREISPETVVILDELLQFIPIWDLRITDQYIWPLVSFKLRKYKPFVKFDREKLRKITLEQFSA